jgi:chemotaxis protein methyltransferase CheR
VLIYFDPNLKADVLRRIANVMAPDGSLLLGASETVLGVTDALTLDPAHRGLYSKNVSSTAPKMFAVGGR